MGQKDISEKTFIALNDVFADIFNVLVFGGKQLMVTAFWMAVVFCIDCCFVSPFGAMLYEFW